jgi:hypothetical protein
MVLASVANSGVQQEENCSKWSYFKFPCFDSMRNLCWKSHVVALGCERNRRLRAQRDLPVVLTVV